MPDNEPGPTTEFALPPNSARPPKSKPVPLTVIAPQPPTVAHPLIPLLTAGDLSADSHPHWVIPGYTIEAEIARGGMGVVYRARELAFDRDVALKLLRDRFSADSAAARRFLDEARITGQLQHPAIPPVHHIGTLPDGRPFLAMKLIKGDTLADLLDRAPNDRGRFVPAFLQVCQAVAYAHSWKVIHRDLKPANVMVGAFGEVQVMDWGLAKVLTGQPEVPGESERPVAPSPVTVGVPDDALATQEGSILGTPAFISPEQAGGAVELVDERADVFGLGAVLCAILTGEAPYSSPDPETVRIQATSGDTREAFARLDSTGADPELVALCKRCLARDREARPRDAAEVARAVTAHLVASEERAKQAELRRVRAEGERAAAEAEAAERRKRRRVQLALAGALLSALALAGFGAALGALWQTAKRAHGEAETALGLLEIEKKESEAARDRAERLKSMADSTRDEAVRQTGVAERALVGEAAALQKVEVIKYGRTVQVAYDQWRDGNVASARKLLEDTRPEFRGWEWHHLNRLCYGSLLTVKGHRGELVSAVLDAAGARILTGGRDGTARVWDAVTGKELLKLQACETGATSAVFRPDGLQIVTTGADKLAKVWDAITGKELLRLGGYGGVTSAAFHPDGTRTVTGHLDGTARVWDAVTGTERLALEGHKTAVLSVAFRTDGARIVTVCRDGTARVWDTQTGKELVVFPLNETAAGRVPSPTPGLTAAAFSPDGTRIVTVCRDGTARVWDAATGRERSILRGHTNGVSAAAFSPDGARIVTGSADFTAKVWDARTGRELFALKGHTDPVTAACFSSDGSRIVTGSEDHTAKVWDARTGADVLALAPHETAAGALPYRSGHAASVTAAAFSRDDNRILTGSLDATAKLWDARTGAEASTFRGDTSGVLSAALSPDGNRIATTSSHRAWVRDARTGKELLKLTGHTGEVTAVAFRADGERIVTASRDKTARVCDAQTGKELVVLNGHTGWVMAATFSPDGSRIVTASEDGTAKVWDAQTGKELVALNGHTGWVMAATFSPDGARVVTGGEDGTAKVWDAQSGKELFSLKGHTLWVSSAAFAPDGLRIVTGSHDKSVKVWDAKTGAELLSLKGHTDQVLSAAFSADGSRIVTGSRDKTARVWDARPVSSTFVETAPR